MFVAGFIGEPPMNILKGQLEREDGVLNFRANGFRLPITNQKQAKVLESRSTSEIVLGVRPTHIDAKRTASDKSVTSELYGLEPHGEHNILSFKIGNEVVLVLSGPGFFPEPGDSISLEFTDNLHFFDAETGKSIFYAQGAENG